MVYIGDQTLTPELLLIILISSSKHLREKTHYMTPLESSRKIFHLKGTTCYSLLKQKARRWNPESDVEHLYQEILQLNLTTRNPEYHPNQCCHYKTVVDLFLLLLQFCLKSGLYLDGVLVLQTARYSYVDWMEFSNH